MIFALIGETCRNHQEDKARYHEQMDDFWREKRKERLWNALFPQGRCRGNWGAAGRMTASGYSSRRIGPGSLPERTAYHMGRFDNADGAAGCMTQKNRPARRQLYKAQRFDLKSIIAWMLW